MKQNAHPDCMAMTVKMYAVATIIRRAMHKPENVSATKDGAAKIVQSHALKATTDWVCIEFSFLSLKKTEQFHDKKALLHF